MNGREVNAGVANGMEMNQKFCQCCGMPMGNTDEQYGTNADGSKNEDYCKYCYADGGFIKEQTLEEMIESCIPFLIQDGDCKTEEEARELLQKELPSLKRWNP